ncbi:MAG: hypothetical protein ACLQLO_09625 [Mycobacterium sp.]
MSYENDSDKSFLQRVAERQKREAARANHVGAKCDQCTATLPHITVRGPGRCTECSFHVATQGHRECCSRTAPVQANKPVTDTRTFQQRVAERFAPERTPRQPSKPDFSEAIAPPGSNPKYVGAAIRADLDRLAATTEGTRNDTLIAVACNVFEFVKAGHADETAARAELERIATAIGLGHSEIRTTLRSAWQRVGPRNVPAPAGVAPAYILESQTP